MEQLPDIMHFFDTLMTDPEQVVEVPKILPEDVPMRAVLRDPQLAEQLVEVPTIVSYSWWQLRMEQTVDIPFLVEGDSLVFKVFSRTEFNSVWCRAALRLPFWWRSSRFSPKTGFAECEQDRCHSRFWCRPSRFSPRTEFILFFARSSSCS